MKSMGAPKSGEQWDPYYKDPEIRVPLIDGNSHTVDDLP